MAIAKEIRYRAYEDWSAEEIKTIQENVAKSPWHTTYHIEPQTGLLNDPNGFSYFNGKFQLFYQNWPFGAGHGLKSWVHTESDDLVHFRETGTILYPDNPHDSHGAYSGSAYEIDGKLFLFYTGNVRDDNWIRDPLQVGAFMDKEGHIEKFDQVLIQQPSDVTEHFRDPQIFDYQGQFFAIIGAQNLEKQGFIKLYKAVNNDIKNWVFVGNLDFGSTGSEYMIECPNLVFVDGRPVLLYSPQGLDKAELDFQNSDKINHQAIKTLAELSKKHHVKLIHISTDYVFDGQGTEPWEPDCKDYAPLNVYGQTKLDGELAVSGNLDKYFIVRIAWVFGLNGKNFIKTMLNVGKTHDTVRVVNDQIGTPTYTYDLARLLVDMNETEKYGYYHATNEGGYISWYDFTKEIYRQAGYKTEVLPVTTAEYGLSKAARPFNSRLDKSKLVEVGFTPLPTWQDALSRYLKEIEQ
mgnify:CR=1 FL=1